MATWREGDTERLTVTVTDDGTEVGSLVGATIELVIRRKGSTVLSKDTADFTASGGVFTLDLGDTDLDGLPEGQYRVECRIVDADGESQSEETTVEILETTI